MTNYNDFAEYMASLEVCEETNSVNPFFVIDGEYQTPALEIL